jgi:adenine phosphoribosyltransferase
MSVPATNSDPIADLKKMIREIPNFPKPGILFYDITTLLKEPGGLRSVIDLLTDTLSGQKIDKVVGIEARGFIFAPALAYRINAGFVPVRKPKKLPSQVESYSYDLEYGQDTVEIHRDSITPGERVVIADDLLATGGTAEAVVKLVEKLGGIVAALVFVVELEFLKGRQRLAGHDVHSLLKYQS